MLIDDMFFVVVFVVPLSFRFIFPFSLETTVTRLLLHLYVFTNRGHSSSFHGKVFASFSSTHNRFAYFRSQSARKLRQRMFHLDFEQFWISILIGGLCVVWVSYLGRIYFRNFLFWSIDCARDVFLIKLFLYHCNHYILHLQNCCYMLQSKLLLHVTVFRKWHILIISHPNKHQVTFI